MISEDTIADIFIKDDTEKLLKFIKSGINGSAVNEYRRKYNEKEKLIYFACQYGSIGVVKILLSIGGLTIEDLSKSLENMLNSYDNYGSENPEENTLEIVELLYSYGADIEYKNSHGKTPLFGAVNNKLLYVTDFLLSVGAEVNIQKNDGYTPLMINCMINQNQTEEEKEEEMKISFEIAKLLINAGADTSINTTHNDSNNTALIIACFSKHSDMIILLVNYCANVNHVNNGGYTPLIICCESMPIDIIELLISHGALLTINQVYSRTGETALIKVINNSKLNKNEKLNIVRVFIEAGADVNHASNYGTALSHSTIYPNIVKLLLEYNTDSRIKGIYNGQTVLHRACLLGKLETIKVLFENDPNIKETLYLEDSYGDFPAMEANTRILSYLISKGLNINKVSSKYYTVYNKGNDFIKYFLDHNLVTKDKVLRSTPQEIKRDIAIYIQMESVSRQVPNAEEGIRVFKQMNKTEQYLG